MGIFTEDYSHETIVFGGGCFWCTEAVFKMLKGVISVEPGYAGGRTESPDYEEVRSGTTGHAEVVKVVYDPHKISLEDLLTVFFASHDSTTVNKQGNDVGEQYRSVILCTTKEQEAKAKKIIEQINFSTTHGKPIVTHVAPLGIFYQAEPEHRDYYEKHPEEAYCRVVINPKLEKVKKNFAKLLKNI